MARIFVLWDIRMQMDRQRVFREISDPYDFSNRDFYNRYRFYKEDKPYLVNKFCWVLNQRPQEADHKLLITLKYFASNCFQNFFILVFP